jgi:glycosyltransferase involved in cell wall biosynthesis
MEMKLAIIHDWLTSYGGAERCVEALCGVWPQADIYTLVYRPDVFRDSLISRHKVSTSFAQRLPWSTTKFRHYFVLYPFAVEQFDLRGYDVVTSFSAAFSHGVLTDPDQVHICYKHTPMRYAWSGYQEYMDDPHIGRWWKRWLVKCILHRMRKWDYLAAQRPDVMLANSEEVRRRIWKYYRREAEVVHPPVAMPAKESYGNLAKEDYYVTIGRAVPYKRMGLIVEAFAQMGDKRLVVAGDGPELPRLRQIAKGRANVEILGFVDEAKKLELLARARAFVFAPHEDFGIAPLEAQACGTPVVAYGRGGALETVVDGVTGVFFEEQTVEALQRGLKRFEEVESHLDAAAIREHAERFSEDVYQRQFRRIVNEHTESRMPAGQCPVFQEGI